MSLIRYCSTFLDVCYNWASEPVLFTGSHSVASLQSFTVSCSLSLQSPSQVMMLLVAGSGIQVTMGKMGLGKILQTNWMVRGPQ